MERVASHSSVGAFFLRSHACARSKFGRHWSFQFVAHTVCSRSVHDYLDNGCIRLLLSPPRLVLVAIRLQCNDNMLKSTRLIS